MTVHQNDGRVTTSATVPSSRSDRDPVQEAVERGAKQYVVAQGVRDPDAIGIISDLPLWTPYTVVAEAILAAALAPYGGLEAIRKLEEGK